jgi:hypothetical protein
MRIHTTESESANTPIESIYFFSDNMNTIFIWVYIYFMYIVCVEYVIGEF